MMPEKADIGLIGLAVMGENLALNMEQHGFRVAVYNRHTDKVDAFICGRGAGKNVAGCHSIEELCASVQSPRKIMLMVKAGKPVDELIEQLLPLLDSGDIIIDGGNSYFQDTIRRTEYLASRRVYFIGAGVSGGEEGALLGPSIMPGGTPQAWQEIRPIFQAIAAQAENGQPCCEWVGNDGAGHYVKMVHNGIEYGDMQLICEAYWILKNILNLQAEELHDVFAAWNRGDLNSYLIEITRDIFAQKDPDTGKPVVDIILDTAGQKGTGKWTSQSALDLGCAAPTVAEAVFARCISAMKEERQEAAKKLPGPAITFSGNKAKFIEKVRKALYASKICSYAQGYQLMKMAAQEYNWDLNFGEIALLWRGGCIIRAQFLDKIKEAFDKKPALPNLLQDDYFQSAVGECQSAWREVVATAVINGIPIPAFASALSYFDSYRSASLPANLLQAQRDCFGAHTYEREDRPRGQFYHTDWTVDGGSAVPGVGPR